MFTPATTVEKLLHVLLRGDVDVVAGTVIDKRCDPKQAPKARRNDGRTCSAVPSMIMPVGTEVAPGGGWAVCPKAVDKHFNLRSDIFPEQCFRTSWVRQFFLANTTALGGSGWDDEVGPLDHFHGMWRLRLANARMLWCNSLCVVQHYRGVDVFHSAVQANSEGSPGMERLPDNGMSRVVETIQRNQIVKVEVRRLSSGGHVHVRMRVCLHAFTFPFALQRRVRRHEPPYSHPSRLLAALGLWLAIYRRDKSTDT